MIKFYLVALGIFVVDQLSKQWALMSCHQPFVVIDNFFSLALVFNPGSLWGIGRNCTYILALLGFIIIPILFIYIHRLKHPTLQWLIAILAGGIAGNTFDRLFRGHVIDFLDFHLKNWHWPCFNVADIAITSVCLFLIFFHRKH